MGIYQVDSGYSAASLRRMFQAQGGRCIYCEMPAVILDDERGADLVARGLIPPPGAHRRQRFIRYRRATIEHVHRRADGGSDDPVNLVMACAFCNSFRGEVEPMTHKAAMMRLVERGAHPLCPEAVGRSGGRQRAAIAQVLEDVHG